MRATAWATATVAVLALWLASMVGAGTADDPEITDPAGDQNELDALAAADILAVWITNETVTSFEIHVSLSGTPSGGTFGTSEYNYNVSFAVGAANFSAIADVNADGSAASGVASNVTVGEDAIVMVVPRASVGDPAAGALITGLVATTDASLLSPVPLTASDRAPDEGAGRDYTFTVGPGATTTTTTTTTTSTTTTTGTTTTSTTTTTGTTTSTTTTTSSTTTGPPVTDPEDGDDLQTLLLEEHAMYFYAAVGLGLLLVILAAIGLKRWSL